MRRIPVDLSDLELAMNLGSGEFAEPFVQYLDLETGKIICVWESDDDYASTMNDDPEMNQRNREKTENQPDRYVGIPELDTLDDNDMLRRFLKSNRTDDDEKW